MRNIQKIFNGKIVSLETATTTLPNGHDLDMEIVRHPGGAAVVVVNSQRQVCLLKQYRCVLDKWLWELPAGKIDDMEPPLDTAKRELAEEAGISAAIWQELGYMISSPGVFTERVHLYLATELSTGAANQEDHEVFDVHWIGFDQALDWALQGNITDAKTVIGLIRGAKALS